MKRMAQDNNQESISNYYLLIGKAQAHTLMVLECELQQAEILREILTNKKYRQATGYKTVSDLCKVFGISRQKAYQRSAKVEILRTAVLEQKKKMGLS